MNEVLSDIYYRPDNPASFRSIDKLFTAAKKKLPHLTKRHVLDWLKHQNTYTLHRQRRRKFKRNPIVVENIDEQFQADLVDMQAFKKENNGFGYILTVIDILSKFAFAVPIKTKTSSNIVKAFEKIFKIRKPFKLQTDRGKEFVNSEFKQFLKKHKVLFFNTHNDEIKCSVVERFNRTLKSTMWKYFTAKGTRHWLDVLDDLTSAYNNSIHRTTRMRPADVTHDNDEIAFKNIYGYNSLRDLLKSSIAKSKLNIGDKVRIPHKLGIMDKGYYPLWTDTIYDVSKTIKEKEKPLVKIQLFGENKPKRFYPEEVQKVNVSEYRVEKIIKKRKNKGKIEYLIKWLGYPESFNSWEPAENIRRLK